MKLVNLTPHALNLYNDDGTLVTVLPPSGLIARAAVTRRLVGGAIPCYIAEYGDLDGLPAPDGESLFVVSLLVRQAVPDRADVASPGRAIRDADGVVIGAVGLDFNAAYEDAPDVYVDGED